MVLLISPSLFAKSQLGKSFKTVPVDFSSTEGFGWVIESFEFFSQPLHLELLIATTTESVSVVVVRTDNLDRTPQYLQCLLLDNI